MVWAEVQSRVDTDNLAAYCIMQIWGGNDDWPQNNIKWWRPNTPEGRWRWMLYDTDFVFGRFDSVHVNVLNHLYNSNADTAVLFRALMENDDFRQSFVNRYADYLNQHFRPARTRQLMFEIYQEMSPEIDRHMTRWEKPGTVWCEHQSCFLDCGASGYQSVSRPTQQHHPPASAQQVQHSR